jgi:hypothetical protein
MLYAASGAQRGKKRRRVPGSQDEILHSRNL